MSQEQNASSSKTIRISKETHATLRRLAADQGKTMRTVLDEAVREYEKKRFFDDLNACYTALRNDPQAWQEELEERRAWEVTLMDGIDRDEIWHEDGTVTILNTTEE